MKLRASVLYASIAELSVGEVSEPFWVELLSLLSFIRLGALKLDNRQ